MKTLTLASDGQPPTISITIGQAQFGTFQVMIERPTGWDVIHSGSSKDPVADLPFGSLSDLDDKVLRWDIVVTVLKVPGAYEAVAVIRQGQMVIEEKRHKGKITKKGDNPAIFTNQRKVVVQ